MGKLTAFVLLITAASCQAMYGKPSEPLLKIPKKPHKAVPDLDPVISYVDRCDTNFRGDPNGVSIDRSRATELMMNGDTSIQQSEKVADASSRAKVVSAGIDHYRNALSKDPYNAEATLKLAVAYDKVYRRGCALKLLARIAVLENHPKFRTSARRVVAWVTDTPELFKGYRQDAIAVLNGAPPTPSRP